MVCDSSVSRSQILSRVFVGHHVCEGLEELCREFLGRALDQTAAQLGDFPANIGFGRVLQKRRAILFHQRYIRAAFGVACSATVALTGQRKRIRRAIGVQRHVPAEPCLHRPHFQNNLGFKLGVGMLDQLFAAGNALLQDFRVVQGGVDVGLGASILISSASSMCLLS